MDDGHGIRTMGLASATGVGVGAIVGGGILALAGTAFATAGPAAVLAFVLNGIVALLTAMSFAALSSRFPASGGTYTFAKKVLSVESAFAVGWIVWFASVVAAVLYAVGFAAFAIPVVEAFWQVTGSDAPDWLATRAARTVLAAGATIAYLLLLTRSGGGGGNLINIGKLLVFGVLIAAGAWMLTRSPAGTITQSFTPFLPTGVGGLLTAMGFTFIALQGFDLIAAVAGEVREPAKTIPRAMLLSLGIALIVYVPLLVIVATVGVPAGTTILEAAKATPDTLVANAAREYLGSFGYWLVIVAAVLSMLSALQANLFAASRVALTMARDRTLPILLERPSKRGQPVHAVMVTGVLTLVVLVLVPDVASAGAAASLIFLISFALAHMITILARVRVAAPSHAFTTPLFPAVPILGGIACAALAVFQAVAVRDAGVIVVGWLGIGAVLFIGLFGRGARVRDAASEASDPRLRRLRGRRPLVLVPVANPANAPAMVELAHALAMPGVGRVTLVNVVPVGTGETPRSKERIERSLSDAQAVLRESLLASLSAGHAPEALTTVAEEIWPELMRIARAHDCESLLLGLSDLDAAEQDRGLERLIAQTDCDTVVLRAAPGWRLGHVRRILVPTAGGGPQAVLRARLVGSLSRDAEHEITYLSVARSKLEADRLHRMRRTLEQRVADESYGRATLEIIEAERVLDAITAQAREHDLVILGLQRVGRRRKLFGELSTQIARETSCAIIMIASRS